MAVGRTGPRWQFKFVEYPPEAPKPPSGEEIVRLMEERRARRAKAALAKEAAVAAAEGSRPLATPGTRMEVATSNHEVCDCWV